MEQLNVIFLSVSCYFLSLMSSILRSTPLSITLTPIS